MKNEGLDESKIVEKNENDNMSNLEQRQNKYVRVIEGDCIMMDGLD